MITKRISSIALMVGTVGIALGSGYFMEHSGPTVSRYGYPVTDQSAQAGLSKVELTASPLPDIPVDIFQELNMPGHGISTVAATEQEIRIPDVVAVQGGFDCRVDLTAQASIAAMVNIELHAACLPDTRVTLHHNGLMVSELTDAQGELFVTMPALTEKAVFIADLGSGSGATAIADVPSLQFYDRVVVQWQGNAGVNLHALEFGAVFGEEGHIWAEQIGSLEKTVRGEGGFLTQMGDPDLPESLQAQVYTFPSGTASRSGDIRLEIDAEVTKANCGRDINAQSMQIAAAGQPHVQELQLSMPDCDAVGEFLVLKNVLEDLKVASK